MKVVYEPTGAALEYAKLALNPYKGCVHRCVYCYNNGRFGKKGAFFEGPKPRTGIAADVQKDLVEIKNKYHGHDCPEIQISFLGDAYQPAEISLGLTKLLARKIMSFDIPFTILTKSNLILRDLDFLAGYPKFRLGMSFTTVDPNEAIAWEPGTGYIEDRIKALKLFKAAGCKTWVSLEPVMRVESTLKTIKLIHPFVDFFHVGALNHIEPPKPIYLPEAYRDIMVALEFHHCQYKFKKSFTDM